MNIKMLRTAEHEGIIYLTGTAHEVDDDTAKALLDRGVAFCNEDEPEAA